jgi:hypothetical protein
LWTKQIIFIFQPGVHCPRLEFLKQSMASTCSQIKAHRPGDGVVNILFYIELRAFRGPKTRRHLFTMQGPQALCGGGSQHAC